MEVVIGGRRMYLWRAVDIEGEVLNLLVRRRDTAAAGEADQSSSGCRLTGGRAQRTDRALWTSRARPSLMKISANSGRR